MSRKFILLTVLGACLALGSNISTSQAAPLVPTPIAVENPLMQVQHHHHRRHHHHHRRHHHHFVPHVHVVPRHHHHVPRHHHHRRHHHHH